jgi:tetratricopeptide (TPR) repeat protein
MYTHQRNREKAESLLRQALEMRTRLYGQEHPAVASALYNLANVTHFTRGWAAAERQYRQALEIQERRLVPRHYSTAKTRLRLGVALYQLERYDESEAALRQAIAELSDKPVSGMAIRANAARRHLAECLIHQQKFEEAELVLFDALRDAQTRFADTPEPSNVAASFLELYRTWGKSKEAEQWEQEVEAKTASSKPNQAEANSPSRQDLDD